MIVEYLPHILSISIFLLGMLLFWKSNTTCSHNWEYMDSSNDSILVWYKCSKCSRVCSEPKIYR